MKELDFSALRDVRHFDNNLFECTHNNKDYFGFIVEYSRLGELLEICHSFHASEKVVLPSLYAIHKDQCYFLAPGILDTVEQSPLAQDLIKLSSVCEGFLEICDFIEEIEYAGFDASNIKLSAFSWPLPIQKIRFFDFSSLLSPSNLLVGYDKVRRRNEALGRILFWLLASKHEYDIEYLKALRPTCPTSIFELVGELNSRSKLSFVEIRNMIAANGMLAANVKGKGVHAQAFGQSFLSKINDNEGQHLLVKIEHHDPSIVKNFLTDLSSLDDAIVLDASDPCSLIYDTSLDVVGYAKVIVGFPEILSEKWIKKLLALGCQCIFVFHSSDKGSLLESVCDGSFKGAGFVSITLDLTKRGISGFLREKGTYTRRDFEIMVSILERETTSLFHLNQFIDHLMERESTNGKLDEGIVPSLFSTSKYVTQKLCELIAEVSEDRGNILRMCFAKGVPLHLEYTSFRGIDRDIIDGLTSNRFGSIVKSQFGDFFVPAVRLQREIDVILSVECNAYVNFASHAKNSVGYSYAYLKAIQDISEAYLDYELIVKICSVFENTGTFEIIAAQIEKLAFASRREDLIYAFLLNLSSVNTINYNWEAIAKEFITSRERLVRCLEKLIDFYKRKNEHDKSIEAGLFALNLMGVIINPKVSRFTLYYQATKTLVPLSMKGVDSYFGKKTTIEKQSETATIMRLCAKMVAPAYILAPELLAAIALKSIRFCRGGVVVPYAPQMMMTFAIIAAHYGNRILTAERIFLYASALIAEFDMKESVFPVDFFYLTMIRPYLNNVGLEEAIDAAYRQAKLEDEEYASYISGASLAYALYHGNHIKVVSQRIRNELPSIIRFNHNTPVTIHKLVDAYVQACRTDLALKVDTPIREHDGTSIFTYHCLNMLLSFFGRRGDVLEHFQKAQKFAFGNQGLLTHIVAEQVATYELYRRGKVATLIRIAAKLYLYKVRNQTGFSVKYSHVSALLLGALGLRPLMFSRLLKAADDAVNFKQPVDAAIIHDTISRLSRDSAIRYSHAIHAARLYESAGYTGPANVIKQYFGLNEVHEGVWSRLQQFNDWLLRSSLESINGQHIERKLIDLLDAHHVKWFGQHDVIPGSHVNYVDEAKYKGQALHLEEGGTIYTYAPVLVDESYQGCLHIQHRSHLHELDYVQLFVDALAFALGKRFYLRKAQSAIASEIQLRSHLPVFQHEICTPLSAILHLSTAAIENRRVDINDLPLIQDACHEIYRIVDAISESDTVEIKKPTVSSYPINLAKEVESIARRLRLGCNNKDIEFLFEDGVSPDLWVMTDPMRLRSILSNLADNAVKYTDEGFVRLSAFAGASGDDKVYFEFSVQDTGIGIAKESQDKIWDKNYRVDTSTSRRSKGLGIGLWQCSRYTKALGGTISLSSDVDFGSNFTFECSFEKTYPRQEEVRPVTQTKLSALVVDDDTKYSIPVTRSVLSRFGISMVVVTSGKEAIEIAKRERFDVIFMDIEMPVMDGFDTIKRINEITFQSPVKVGITAHRNLQEDSRYTSGCFHVCMLKPISNESVALLLEEWFGIYNAADPLDEPIKKRSVNIDLENAFRTGLSLNEVVSILKTASQELETSEAVIRDYVKHEDRPGLKRYLHTLQSPLYMFKSPVADFLLDLRNSPDVLTLVSSNIFNVLNELKLEIDMLLEQFAGSLDDAGSETGSFSSVDSDGVIKEFETLLESRDLAMYDFYQEHKSVIDAECGRRSIKILEESIAGFNGAKALGVLRERV